MGELPPQRFLDAAAWAAKQARGSEEGGDPGGAAAAPEEELPMVLLCAGCKRPVGNTLHWEANDEATSCLILRNVSPNVTVDKELKPSSWPEEHDCMVETLFCSGCKMTLGSIYRCTPGHLDFKRDLYSVNVHSLESYILGSADQKADVDKEPLTLGSQAILEELLESAEATLKELERRISLIESGFASLPK